MKTLKPREIAAYCDVHHRTVSRWIANEQLEAVERPLWQQRVEQLKEAHPLILDGSDELFR